MCAGAIARAAAQAGCRAVAYTYNDPVIFLEYAIDVALACRARPGRRGRRRAPLAVGAGIPAETSAPGRWRGHWPAQKIGATRIAQARSLIHP